MLVSTNQPIKKEKRKATASLADVIKKKKPRKSETTPSNVEIKTEPGSEKPKKKKRKKSVVPLTTVKTELEDSKEIVSTPEPSIPSKPKPKRKKKSIVARPPSPPPVIASPPPPPVVPSLPPPLSPVLSSLPPPSPVVPSFPPPSPAPSSIKEEPVSPVKIKTEPPDLGTIFNSNIKQV